MKFRALFFLVLRQLLPAKLKNKGVLTSFKYYIRKGKISQNTFLTELCHFTQTPQMVDEYTLIVSGIWKNTSKISSLWG